MQDSTLTVLEQTALEAFPEAMPSLNHSYLCTQIVKQLLQTLNILPLTELTLDIDQGLTPDICVYPANQITPDFFNDVSRYGEMPIVAIEIISASQNIQMLLQKAQRFLEAGIPCILTLEPYSRTVFVS